MSEWRRTPLAMHQRRGAGGGVRACGARARERAESSGAGRGEGKGQRDSSERQHRRWYCTAEYCGRVGSRHFRESPSGLSFFVPATLYSLHVAVRTEGTDVYCMRCAGEAVEAHRECPGDIRRSKCAARVRSSPHRCKDIEFLIVAATFGSRCLRTPASLFLRLCNKRTHPKVPSFTLAARVLSRA